MLVTNQRIKQSEKQKARRLYKTLFGKEFPKDWTINFQYGATSFRDKEINIYTTDCVEDCLDTLVHEFTHLEHPTWQHGKRFSAEVKRLLKMVVRY